MREIYLDANATVRPLDSVVSAVARAMRDTWGNPSSAHRCGAAAWSTLEDAREAVAALLTGIDPDYVVLTSGGTEGSNAVLSSATDETTIVITAVEHPATRIPAERAAEYGASLVVIPVDTNGWADPADFGRAVSETENPKVLVSVQWANGETGVVQPIREIVQAVRSARPDSFIHVDAAQAIGRIPTPTRGISALTFSGHKLHGPQGTGALACGEDGLGRVPAWLEGGGQERSLRSGTQNVAGAAGLAAALEARALDFGDAVARMRALRDAFEARISERVGSATINAQQSARTPNTSNIRFAGVDGMSLVARLDAQGIRCSQGSACSAGRPEPSRVLRAMDLSEDEAYSSVRFSFSVLNTEEDVEDAARAIEQLVGKPA